MCLSRPLRIRESLKKKIYIYTYIYNTHPHTHTQICMLSFGRRHMPIAVRGWLSISISPMHLPYCSSRLWRFNVDSISDSYCSLVRRFNFLFISYSGIQFNQFNQFSKIGTYSAWLDSLASIVWSCHAMRFEGVLESLNLFSFARIRAALWDRLRTWNSMK